MKFQLSAKILVPAVTVVILIVASAAVFFFVRYRQAQEKLNNPTLAARAETERLLWAVGRLMELPTGEEPTVATVTDAGKLKEQPFFQNSQNGDKLIIFTGAKRAILFRPSSGKIIDVAPINLGTGSATLQTSPSPETTSAKVALLNGTTTVGLTRKYETQLKQVIPGIEVVLRDNAKKRDFAKTILVDITGNKTTQAGTLAQTLGISLDKLPEGENASAAAGGSADFLIIVGEDKK